MTKEQLATVALVLIAGMAMIFAAVGFVYDLGVRQGEIQALKTAYEVCRKVAPCK